METPSQVENERAESLDNGALIYPQDLAFVFFTRGIGNTCDESIKNLMLRLRVLYKKTLLIDENGLFFLPSAFEGYVMRTGQSERDDEVVFTGMYWSKEPTPKEKMNAMIDATVTGVSEKDRVVFAGIYRSKEPTPKEKMNAMIDATATMKRRMTRGKKKEKRGGGESSEDRKPLLLDV